MNHIIVFIVYIFLSYTSLKAQESGDFKKLQVAISYYNGSNSKEAFEILDQVINKNPFYDHALFVKGQWEINRNDYSKALVALEKLNEVNPSFNPLQDKMIAECYFNQRDMDKALSFANKFLKHPNLSPESYTMCERLIKNIEFVKNQGPNEDINFVNLGANINTTNDEYFPSTTADDAYLYFTRNSRDENIYISKNSNGQWLPAVKIDEPEYKENGEVLTINSDVNDGAHTISPSGKYLFFTSCNRPFNIGKCDLYYAKMNGGVWNSPKMLKPPINTKYWDSQPCISSDGKKLFFVSARPEGLGGSDIYMSEITPEGTYTEPINLGNVINTTGNEDRPFLHPDGQSLYFSSNGHPGYGDNDLFLSRYENGAWQKPINLGGTINSAQSERSIFVSSNGSNAYISKQVDVDGKLNFDIFSFLLPEAYRPLDVTYIKGIVLNATTNQPIKTSIKVYNNTTMKNVTNISSDEKNGDFLLTIPLGYDYGFNVNKEGFALFSQNYTFEKKDKNEPQIVTIRLKPLEKGTKFELRNVFFETGKSELLPNSTTELTNVYEILKANPLITILISGHTDNIGQESSNKTLSESRANAVLEFLKNKGIDPSRLSAKGFGSKMPISTNDTEEGRAQNRRTEIEIL